MGTYATVATTKKWHTQVFLATRAPSGHSSTHGSRLIYCRPRKWQPRLFAATPHGNRSPPVFQAHTPVRQRSCFIRITVTVCACVFGRRSLSLFRRRANVNNNTWLELAIRSCCIYIIYCKYTCPICRTATSMSHFVFDLSPPTHTVFFTAVTPSSSSRVLVLPLW